MNIAAIEQIHNLVKEFLNRPNVKSRIQQALNSENRRLESLSESDVMQLLKRLSLYDDLEAEIAALEKYSSFQRNKENQREEEIFSQQTQPQKPKDVQTARFGLLFKIVRGRAFVDFLNPQKNTFFQISACFDGERKESQKVASCVDPEFLCEFFFSFETKRTTGTLSLEDLVKLNSAVQLSILLLNEKTGEKFLYSLKNVEWRYILSHGVVNITVELVSYKHSIILKKTTDGQRNSIGSLQLQMELITVSRPIYLPERLLNDQMSAENKALDSFSLRFYEYSTNWWNEYKATYPDFQNRIVKMYCETDEGNHKPMVAMVRPLTNTRGIDSPYHAARFVSLIPFEAAEKPGGERIALCHSFHNFLSKGKGDVEDHANLLASLLLGFGFSAFVVCGESIEGVHTWVVTFDEKSVAMYWEPLTGQKLKQEDPRVIKYYRKIGCLFNHKSFYANLQIDDSVKLNNSGFKDEIRIGKQFTMEEDEFRTNLQFAKSSKRSISHSKSRFI